MRADAGSVRCWRPPPRRRRLQTAHELTRNIDQISRLIQGQHRQDQFSYLTTLADELHEVLPLLPAHVLEDLLDSLQKSSAFEKGLQVLRLLDVSGAPSTPAHDAYRVRYLTPAYRYREALELSRGLGDVDEWIELNTITTLMALAQDDEALQRTSEMLEPDCSTEVQAVLRRNTIHLFDPGTALRHLDEAYRYFEHCRAARVLPTARGPSMLIAGSSANRSASSESMTRRRYENGSAAAASDETATTQLYRFSDTSQILNY